MLRRNGFRYSDRHKWRLLRPLLHPYGRDATIRAHHEAVHRQAAGTRRPGTRHNSRYQNRAPATERDEALNGGDDRALSSCILRVIACPLERFMPPSRRQRASSEFILSLTAPITLISARSEH